MPLFEVAFTLVPSIKAQEAGQEETLAVAPVAVTARDASSAVAQVAGLNAAKMAPTDGSTLVTHVRTFPSTLGK